MAMIVLGLLVWLVAGFVVAVLFGQTCRFGGGDDLP